MMLLDSKGREDKKGEKGWAAAVGNLQIHGQCVMLSTKNFRSNPWRSPTDGHSTGVKGAGQPYICVGIRREEEVSRPTHDLPFEKSRERERKARREQSGVWSFLFLKDLHARHADFWAARDKRGQSCSTTKKKEGSNVHGMFKHKNGRIDGPKSVSLHVKSSVMSTFSALMSRCTIGGWRPCRYLMRMGI